MSDGRVEYEVRADTSNLESDLKKAENLVKSSADTAERNADKIGESAEKANKKVAESAQKAAEETEKYRKETDESAKSQEEHGKKTDENTESQRKYKAEVEELTEKTRSHSKDLSEINSLLEKNSKSTQLLAQKKEVLKNAVSDTAKKLAVLENAQKEVEQAFRKGEIPEEEYREFQREIIATKNELDDLSEELSSVGKRVEDTSAKTADYEKVLNITGQTLAAIGAAAAAFGTAAVSSSDKLDKSLNQLSASLGLSAEEAEHYEDTIKSIYENNYGDGFEDIANNLALVKQQMSDISDDELKKAVESGYLLNDVYGIDIQESIRGANAMVNQFGISATEAYNLMAQGAEKGLNQNGDLADQIAEYATYYNNLGFSAQDAFNMMAAGAENGVYQIDKINDAVKEFSIRAIDGSDSTVAGFKALGLDADKLAQTFAEGGEQSAEAFQLIINKLAEMDDKVAQDAAGVALFGTQWEDVGAEAILALGSVNSEIDITRDKLSEMEGVKYTSLSDSFEAMKRSIELLLEPLGEQLIPMVSDFTENIIPMAEEIIPKLGEELLSVAENLGELAKDTLPVLTDILGIVISAISTATNIIYDFKEVIVVATSAILAYKAALSITSIITAVTKALDGMTIAQYALNLAMNLNPVGLVAGAIVALTAEIVILVSKLNGCSAEVKKMAEELNNMKKSIDDSVQSGEAETALLQDKADRYEELRTKIELTAAEENELKALADDLQSVFGDEIKVIDELTGEYADLTDQIGRYIEKKNQEIKLSAYEEAAKDAYIEIGKIDKEIAENNRKMREIESKNVNFINQYDYIEYGSNIEDLNKTRAGYQEIIDEYNSLLSQTMQSNASDNDNQGQNNSGYGQTTADYYRMKGEEKLNAQKAPTDETPPENSGNVINGIDYSYTEPEPEPENTGGKATGTNTTKTGGKNEEKKQKSESVKTTAPETKSSTSAEKNSGNVISITSYIPTIWDDEEETNKKLKKSAIADLVGNSNTGKLISGLMNSAKVETDTVSNTVSTAEKTLSDVVDAIKKLEKADEIRKISLEVDLHAREFMIGKIAVADINDMTKMNGKSPLIK